MVWLFIMNEIQNTRREYRKPETKGGEHIRLKWCQSDERDWIY